MLTEQELSLHIAPGITFGEVPGRVADATCVRTGERTVAVQRWVAAMVLLDACIAAVVAPVAIILRFGGTPGTADGISYVALAAPLPVLWVLCLASARAYDRRFLAAGTEEFRRVGNAGLWLLAAVVVLSFAFRLDLSRGLIAMTVPLLALLTAVARLVVRRRLQRCIARGTALHRVVVAGTRSEVEQFVRHLSRTAHAGLVVVGACIAGNPRSLEVGGSPVPVLGGLRQLTEAARSAGADIIAVAGTGAVSGSSLRRLSWTLEGSGIDLIVAPAIADLAGPRIQVRPLGGLPLLHVEEPEFRGARRLAKEVLDRCAAAMLLLLLGPALLAIATAIRIDSPGPAIFRQTRIGLRGRPFGVTKFRTMRAGADGEIAALAHLNEGDGPLFKIRQDPRITGVGRWLRRYSLDELPQLWNVLSGSMSLVGPRPPLPSEVERYASEVRRRLLVKPGITGLWQVSGRSDLSWEDAVWLDLHYVENWSVGLDALVLWKTVGAVLSGRGAY
jgi:exopolysaccharide biosynthesis polyprenyl glycosylphosphotransferase